MTVAHDKITERELANFQIHYSAMSNSEPYAMHKALDITDVATTNISSFIMHGSKEGDECYMDDKVKGVLYGS